MPQVAEWIGRRIMEVACGPPPPISLISAWTSESTRSVTSRPALHVDPSHADDDGTIIRPRAVLDRHSGRAAISQKRRKISEEAISDG